MTALSDPRAQKACELRAKGKTRLDAYNEAFEVPADSKSNNSSRFFRRKDVQACVAEKQQRQAALANFDGAWAMIELGRRVDGFNLDDYLTRDKPRSFRLDDCSRDQLGKLAEVTIEEFVTDRGDDKKPETRLKRTKIKPYDPTSVINLMAELAGWKAPKKIAPTDADGKTLTLEQLVGASMALGKAAA